MGQFATRFGWLGMSAFAMAAALPTTGAFAQGAAAVPPVSPTQQPTEKQFPGAKVQRAELEAQEPAKAPKQGSLPVLTVGNTEISFSGFIKVDTSVSHFSEGELASGSNGRDFYIPSTIPVAGEQAAANADSTVLDFSARETRFRFKTKSPVGAHQVHGFLELDFMATAGGNERISNSYSPRLRHAFVKVDNVWGGSVLAGQTWSTFFDVSALPENLDFIGPVEATNFVRQPLVRYTRGPWEFALEQPESTITPNGGGASATPGDDRIPDFVTRYKFKGDWGHIAVAGLMRELRQHAGLPGGAAKANSFGYAGTVSGRIKVGEKDDIRFSGTAGDGVGRYVGLNTTAGAVIDGSDDLETISAYAGYLAYRHFWNDEWRSTANVGYLSIDNPTTLTGTGATSDVFSAHVNLLYSPHKALVVGGEALFASREEESGADGSMWRGMVSLKYSF